MDNILLWARKYSKQTDHVAIHLFKVLNHQFQQLTARYKTVRFTRLGFKAIFKIGTCIF